VILYIFSNGVCSNPLTDKQKNVNYSSKIVGLKKSLVVLIVWELDLQLPMQSVPITTKVVNSNLVCGEVYSIQHYVI
jgi:hypothetical protein